uniref:BPTI/Kunitz inhibitor domain-containing protein n=1 Tax=Meloidogyne floridensis TaxID=298350 RepID=A0A915P000_9BILA
MFNKNYKSFNKKLIIILFFVVLIDQNVLTESQKERNENENPRAENPRKPYCSLPHDKGVSCSGTTSPKQNSKQFYYNSQTGLCQPFIYNGCEGNDNRFESASACRKACSSSEKRDPWVLAKRCNASYLIPDGNYIECPKEGGGGCPEGHECSRQREFLCSLPDDSGTFAEGVPDKPRFAWSSQVNSCWRFSYYGAKGNYNNFPNFQECVNFCGNEK